MFSSWTVSGLDEVVHMSIDLFEDTMGVAYRHAENWGDP